MGTTYPGRPKEFNQTELLSVRLTASQMERLKKLTCSYDMSVSNAVREAITIWINMNTNNKGE